MQPEAVEAVEAVMPGTAAANWVQTVKQDPYRGKLLCHNWCVAMQFILDLFNVQSGLWYHERSTDAVYKSANEGQIYATH